MKSSIIEIESNSNNQLPQKQQVQDTKKQPEILDNSTFQTVGQQQQYLQRQIQLPYIHSYIPTYETHQAFSSYPQHFGYFPHFKNPYQLQTQFISPMANIHPTYPLQYPSLPFNFIQQYPQTKEFLYMHQIGQFNQLAQQTQQQQKQQQVFQTQKALYEQQMKQQHPQQKNQQQEFSKMNDKSKQEQNEQKEVQNNFQVSLQKNLRKEEGEIQLSGKKQKIQNQEDQMVQINKTKVTINLKKLNELKLGKNPIKEDISVVSINGIDSKSSDQIKQTSAFNESSKSIEKRRRINNYNYAKDFNFVHLVSQPRAKKNGINRFKPHRIEKKIAHMRNHHFNFRKVSTRQTQCTNNDQEYFEFMPFNHIKNEGFSRIGEQYQVDIEKASIRNYQQFIMIVNDQFDLETMKKKLQIQKLWNGQKNLQIYNEIYEKVKEQIYQGVTHQDILTIIHSFNNNIQLLHKKLLEKDPVVVHEILELRLSFKKQDVYKQKINQSQ